MQVVRFRSLLHASAVSTALSVLVGVVATAPAAHAAAGPVLVDTALIASLQVRARQAAPREQVQIYADLVDKMSLLIDKQLADGDEEKAQGTLRLFDSCAAELEVDLHRDSKNLKRTEMLLHTTHRRLADLVRSASGDMKPLVQNAVNHLDRVQNAFLSSVFEH